MSEKPKVKLDHVSILVDNLEQAIADWQKVLEVLDPEQAAQMVHDSGVENGEHMEWVTWVNPNGCSIQLFSSKAEGGFLRKVLKKRGQYVHHIAFTTTDLDGTIKALKEREIRLVSDAVGPEDKPWLRWTFVNQEQAHGPLIEVATRYRVENGKWVADYDTAKK